MLQKLSEQISACLVKAAEARDRAAAANDPRSKSDFLEMESHWLFLARSYEFAEGVKDFAAGNAQKQKQIEHEQHGNQNSGLLPRQVFDQLPVAVYICETSGLIVYFNDEAARLWGRSPKLNDPDDRFCGSHRMFRVDGSPLLHSECPMADVVRTGIPVKDQEVVIERADGSRGIALVNINPFKDADGKILGAVNCFRDITERKRRTEQIAILGREAEHRVKNILAAVQAAVNLSRSDTLGGLKHAIEGRIQALANVHTLFYESHWKGADLANVAKHELAPYLQDGVARVRIDGPYILLEPTTAQAMAVILHELATNAAKYGALSDTHGRVEFNWSHKPDGQLMLRWMERDGPKIATPKRKGFGARVINQMVKHQLKGEVRLDWRAEGLTCEIAFPIVDQTFSHESREAIDPAGLGVFQPKHAGAVLPLPGSQ